MDVIPKLWTGDLWMLYQRYGCYTKGMDVIPKVWMLYQRYGCYTKSMDVIPKRCYTKVIRSNKNVFIIICKYCIVFLSTKPIKVKIA